MDDYKLGFSAGTEGYRYIAPKGLSQEVVEEISRSKGEQAWMRERRLAALKLYQTMPVPKWGASLTEIKWDDIHYYLRTVDKPYADWEQVPPSIRKVFEVIGVPNAEREQLAGVTSQFDSEKIYGSLQATLAKKGVVFLSMDEGLREYPEIVKKYFGTVVPYGDNKLACLNTAVWSGGSFVYVPRGVEVQLPLQAYFRINSEYAGQFERTLIVVEEGASVHYVEGCSAPAYSSGSLHAAVVEVVVAEGARCRYTTVQNWYKNVYNLVTKRAVVDANARMEWVDCNLGCLTGEILVATPRGDKRIDQIKRGDVVYGLSQSTMALEQHEVLDATQMGKKVVYELVTDDHRMIKATDNHPFLRLKKRNGYTVFDVAWTRLDKLQVGDLIAVAIQLPDDGVSYKHGFTLLSNRLENIPSIGEETDEDLMWFLGAYLGDGFIDYSGGHNRHASRVGLAIPANDKAHPKMVAVLQKWGLRFTQRGVAIRIGSTYLAEMILAIGFDGTAKTKHIPDWVFGLPRSQKLAFIEGYLDTDGSVREKIDKKGNVCGQLIFACTSLDLLTQMKRLMIACGLEPRKITSYRKARKLWKVEKEYISHYLNMNLVPNLGYIRSHGVEVGAVRFVTVRSIEKLSPEMTYDIEVEGVHNFVASGIVVHNSKTTMKYPSCILRGEGAHGEMLSIAVAGEGQHQDAGAKMHHLAPHTTSRITSKSISKGGGRSSYRGMVVVAPNARGARSKVVCDALIMDKQSRSDTYPTNRVMTSDVTLEHEAYVSKVGEEQLLYLMSRGMTQQEAETMIVRGFLEPVMQELPLEYAVELNRLVNLEMTGSVG